MWKAMWNESVSFLPTNRKPSDERAHNISQVTVNIQSKATQPNRTQSTVRTKHTTQKHHLSMKNWLDLSTHNFLNLGQLNGVGTTNSFPRNVISIDCLRKWKTFHDKIYPSTTIITFSSSCGSQNAMLPTGYFGRKGMISRGMQMVPSVGKEF